MALELSTKLNWLNVRIIYLSGIKLLVLKEFLTEKLYSISILIVLNCIFMTWKILLVTVKAVFD